MLGYGSETGEQFGGIWAQVEVAVGNIMLYRVGGVGTVVSTHTDSVIERGLTLRCVGLVGLLGVQTYSGRTEQ